MSLFVYARLLTLLTFIPGLQISTSSPYGEQPAHNNRRYIMEDLKILTKQIELAFIQAFFSYLYKQKLLTPNEISAIRQEVRKSHVLVDSNSN